MFSPHSLENSTPTPPPPPSPAESSSIVPAGSAMSDSSIDHQMQHETLLETIGAAVTADSGADATTAATGSNTCIGAIARPADVLCGRGNLSDNPGNKTFLSIVAKRKKEYKTANTDTSAKNAIASQIIGEFIATSDPPPRFLTPLEGVNKAGVTRKRESAPLWRELGKAEILAKTKMALRQKPRVRKKKGQSAAEKNNARTKETQQSREEVDTSAESNNNLLPEIGPIDLFSADSQAALDEDLLCDMDLLDMPLSLSPPVAVQPTDSVKLPAADTDRTSVAAAEAAATAIAPAAVAAATPEPYASPDPNAATLSSALLAPIAAAPPAGNIRQEQLLSTLQAAYAIIRTALNKQEASASSSLGGTVEGDLHALGRVLYDLFAGEMSSSASSSGGSIVGGASPLRNTGTEVDNDEGRQSSKRERIRVQGSTPYSTGRPSPSSAISSAPLTDFGYPVNLSIFVSSLLNATDDSAVERFTSLIDVENELRCMIANPEKYWFDPPVKLCFPYGKLYGRDKHREELMSAFDSIVVKCEESRGFALISGHSGSGKTSLVETLIVESPLMERRGILIPIKFDGQRQEQPISVIVRAFDDYCQKLQQSESALLAEISPAIKEALGPAGEILKSQMPNLGGIIGDTSSGAFVDVNKTQTYNMILYGLRIFVRAIAAPSHPVVVLLDDLQWADKRSLDLIARLVSDAGTNACLFIGCYRENEVRDDHPLWDCLREIPLSGTTPMWNIFLDNLDKECVNELLSDVLHLSPRITSPLAEALYTKARGNPMFIRQLMRSLCDEGLLQYSASARRWMWDIDAILTKDIPDTAVELVLEMMKSYGSDIQCVLQVAAMIGARFDAATMKHLHAGRSKGFDDGSSILLYLDAIIEDGLVVKDGSALRFSHDQVWQAASSLTGAFDRDRMHLLIGRDLLRGVSLSNDDLDTYIFTIVDQLNRGSALITDHGEKLKVAELNLQAGEKAIAASSFVQASLYMLQGSALLSEEDWNSHYDLCLHLFTSCSEVQLAHGNNDGAIISLNPVLSHGKSLEDKLRAYNTLILATTAQGKLADSMYHALAVLEQLGVSFPSDINQFAIEKDLEKTKALIATCTLEEIVHRPTTTNVIQVEKMRCLISAARIAHLSNQRFLTLIAFRMVQISMNDGLTPESSFAFTVCSFILCGLGKYDLAAFLGKVAMALLEVFHQKYAHITILLLNASVLSYKQPMQACISSFRLAYKNGFSLGDMDWSLSSCFLWSFASIFSPEPGKTLQDVEREMRHTSEELRMCGHSSFNVFLVSFQALINLSTPCPTSVGNNQDPATLTGEVMDQEDVMAEFSEMQAHQWLRRMYIYRMWLSYLFHRYDEAAEMAQRVQGIAMTSRISPLYEFFYERFYLGLIAAAVLRQGVMDDDADIMWRDLATDTLNKFRDWAKYGSEWNFQHKLDLLRAELAFTDGELEAAPGLYEAAICGAKEHCYINEQALACECAALYYLDIGNAAEGERHLVMAQGLYCEWGSTRKVESIRLMLSDLRSV